MKTNSSTYLFALAGIIVIGFLVYAIYGAQGNSNLEPFAKCLTEKKAKMYGSWWCPHCEQQKADFGKAIEFVDFVECSPNRTKSFSEECENAGIESVPRWRFEDGTELIGRQTFEALTEKTGCEVPTEEE